MKRNYLSHQAYNQMGSFRRIASSESYYGLAYKANDVLRHVTERFYEKNDFEGDAQGRKEAYLKALACQIEYFYETGETTTAGLNHTVGQAQLGRTNISMLSHMDEAGNVVPKPLVCPDVYLYLDGFDWFEKEGD